METDEIVTMTCHRRATDEEMTEPEVRLKSSLAKRTSATDHSGTATARSIQIHSTAHPHPVLPVQSRRVSAARELDKIDLKSATQDKSDVKTTAQCSSQSCLSSCRHQSCP